MWSGGHRGDIGEAQNKSPMRRRCCDRDAAKSRGVICGYFAGPSWPARAVMRMDIRQAVEEVSTYSTMSGKERKVAIVTGAAQGIASTAHRSLTAGRGYCPPPGQGRVCSRRSRLGERQGEERGRGEEVRGGRCPCGCHTRRRAFRAGSICSRRHGCQDARAT